ncbi:MAG: formylglycine-generating enzyme family protein [Planctomycetota bacterium]|nr:formylglycine-generating enzyme family protein [Planctomycetota bacterium]
MTTVSWIAACAWLSEVGSGLRLPTEQEWEYGARAGSTDNYFWGSEIDPHYCWYWENSASGARDPTDHSLSSNGFGLSDMLGNVKEWCEDLWRSDYSESGPATIVNNIPAGRITRGGSFRSGSEFLRCSSRSWHRPEWRAIDLGFRVARSISGFHISSGK